MNLWNPEQHARAQRTNAEASFALANKAFESFQKVVDLNLKTTNSGITESKEVMLNALSGISPQEWSILSSGTVERIVPRIQSYYSQLFAIASSTQLEYANVANEHFAGQQRRLQELIDRAAQHAPGAAETVITAWKSAIAATGTWYETTCKAVQQAVHVADSNAEAVSAAMSKTTRQTIERASRAAST